ncbi:hypothetical protein [uncultured Pontibacter sp.]|uniref:hypothetical protein n=1 Tax=uncultured Pontibacter sp. TaxID=453356 RepID=UPI002620F383|nr:hypothetical protein [uncultured Pontibacter sp.]
MLNLTIKLLAAFLLFGGTAAAQSKIYLEPRLGFGTFRMSSLKELQQTVISNSGVSSKAVDTYNPYIQFGLGVVKEMDENTAIGLLLERGSTGGRVAYEDYSGELLFDTPVHYNAIGAMIYTHNAIATSNLEFVAGVELNVFLSQLKTETYARLYDATETDEDKFNSKGIGLKPYMGLQYPAFNLPLKLTVGYMASASQAFHVPGEKKQYLVRNSNSDKLEPGWSGLRLNLTVSVPVFN